MRLVICGTGTDVGKTVISALVVQGLAATYWKPVQSGLEEGGDSGRVRRLLGLPAERVLPEAYRLRAPVSPHWAAAMEGIRIEAERLALPQVSGPLVVETAGGVMVPLRLDWLQIDQLGCWGLPILLVACSGLGTLNHTLLTVEALSRRGLSLIGLVLNGPLHPDNPRTLEQLTGLPVLAQVPPLTPLDAGALRAEWHASGLPDSLAR